MLLPGRAACELGRMAEPAASLKTSSDTLPFAEAAGLEFARALHGLAGMRLTQMRAPDAQGPESIEGSTTHSRTP